MSIPKEQLDCVPRGNTSAGVYRSILENLHERYGFESQRSLLDVPCGRGEFLDAIHQLFPSWRTVGADIDPAIANLKENSLLIDASRPDGFPLEKFDVVSCISGVMEFDNTLTFFESLRKVLMPDGLLIVTNDNVLTVRDRLLYLFFGRFGQYPFSTEPARPTWKIIPLQNMVRILRDAGIEVKALEYVPVQPADWLWLPIAALLFVIAKISLLFRRADAFEIQALRLRSYLSKHYLLICGPNG